MKESVTSFCANSPALSCEQILKALFIVEYLKIESFLHPCILYFKFLLKNTAQLAAVMGETPGRVGGFRIVQLELIGVFMLS